MDNFHTLQRVVARLAGTLKQDAIVQQTTDELRNFLQADRVLLYYFYYHWKGQVTFESLSDEQFSIYGETGADDCFNDEYASWYEAGRIRAIADIESEPINSCHRDFLRSIQVRANLAVPVVNSQGLWGLLIAHYCRGTHVWQPTEIERMKQGALQLAGAASIRSDDI
jgi:GAF domain-containing protein